MSEAIRNALDALFPEQGRSVANVKFFYGYRRDVTANELASELLRARAQVADGTATLVADIDGDLND